MQEIQKWDRPFSVWRYSISHSTLVLMSFDIRAGARVEVRFTGVKRMLLSPNYESLAIMLADDAQISEILPGDFSRPPNMHLFVINDLSSYVYARQCVWHEDQGDFHSPSKFGPLPGLK